MPLVASRLLKVSYLLKEMLMPSIDGRYHWKYSVAVTKAIIALTRSAGRCEIRKTVPRWRIPKEGRIGK